MTRQIELSLGKWGAPDVPAETGSLLIAEQANWSQTLCGFFVAFPAFCSKWPRNQLFVCCYSRPESFVSANWWLTKLTSSKFQFDYKLMGGQNTAHKSSCKYWGVTFHNRAAPATVCVEHSSILRGIALYRFRQLLRKTAIRRQVVSAFRKKTFQKRRRTAWSPRTTQKATLSNSSLWSHFQSVGFTNFSIWNRNFKFWRNSEVDSGQICESGSPLFSLWSEWCAS